MFLKNIEIENIRSIEHIFLDCCIGSEPNAGNRKWTILLGQNGTGKSSLLRAIGLVLAGSDALPFLLGEPDTWIRNGHDTASIAATVQTAQGEERRIELEFKQGMGRTNFVEHNRSSIEPLDAALEHTQRSYFVVGYGALRRLALNESNIARRSGDPVRAESMATLFDLDATLNPLQSWAMGLEYREGKSGTRIIDRAMNGLLPEVTFRGIDRKRGELMFNTPDGEVPLSRLSDGYQNVAAWIGDLLYRITESFDDYQNPLSTRGLLLIDEIDAHLHPMWQRQLRKYINEKLPEFQIIATTHSVLTAHQLEANECAILKRDKNTNAVTLQPFPGVPAELRAHELLEIGFDVETLDSVRMSNQKDRYRSLYRKKGRSASEKREFSKLRQEFEELPERDLSFGNATIIESQVQQRKTIEALLERVEKVTARPVQKSGTKNKVAKKKAATKRAAKKKAKNSRPTKKRVDRKKAAKQKVGKVAAKKATTKKKTNKKKAVRKAAAKKTRAKKKPTKKKVAKKRRATKKRS